MHILLSALSRFTQPTGICRHSANLANCLAATHPVSRVTIAMGSWQERYFRECFDLASRKITVARVETTNNTFSRNWWFSFGLPRLASTAAADLVHLSYPAPVFRSLFSVPVVASIHDLYPYDYPSTFGAADAFVKRVLFRQCLRGSDGFACVSQATIDSLRRHAGSRLGAKRVRLVRNYVEFAPDEAPKAPAGIDSRPFMLSVAQHQKNKRLDLLLAAFARLRSRGTIPTDTRLVLAGRHGPETAGLLALSQSLRLEDDLTWVEGLSDAELAWLYRHCEVFVVCSWIEGFCLPLAEALYHSCRVVCSDIPVLREVAGGAARFFDVRHTPVDNLAEAIADSLSEPRPTLRGANRFSKEDAANDCVGLYRELLAARHGVLAPTRAHAN